MSSRNEMITKLFTKTPGIYFHITHQTAAWIGLFIIFVFVLLVNTVHITLNPPPAEYPTYIDGKKIVFMGYEPQSVAEAREILARYNHKFKDGDRVAVNADDQEDD